MGDAGHFSSLAAGVRPKTFLCKLFPLDISLSVPDVGHAFFLKFSPCAYFVQFVHIRSVHESQVFNFRFFGN